MARRRLKLARKAKKIAYRFIPPDVEEGPPIYALLAELVKEHHDDDLHDAKIALAWNLAWQPDVDGRVTLGKCKKVGDLERELADLQAYDFVIILQQAFWMNLRTTDLMRRALLDHELCHAAVKRDANGEPEVDERGRTVYRIRKHDLEEFACIGERYGFWKPDIAEFFRSVEAAQTRVHDQWIGFRSLQDDLRRGGLSVPVNTIATWSEAERREAATWAILRADLPAKFQGNLQPPAFVLQATETLAS